MYETPSCANMPASRFIPLTPCAVFNFTPCILPPPTHPRRMFPPPHPILGLPMYYPVRPPPPAPPSHEYRRVRPHMLGKENMHIVNNPMADEQQPAAAASSQGVSVNELLEAVHGAVSVAAGGCVTMDMMYAVMSARYPLMPFSKHEFNAFLASDCHVGFLKGRCVFANDSCYLVGREPKIALEEATDEGLGVSEEEAEKREEDFPSLPIRITQPSECVSEDEWMLASPPTTTYADRARKGSQTRHPPPPTLAAPVRLAVPSYIPALVRECRVPDIRRSLSLYRSGDAGPRWCKEACEQRWADEFEHLPQLLYALRNAIGEKTMALSHIRKALNAWGEAQGMGACYNLLQHNVYCDKQLIDGQFIREVTAGEDDPQVRLHPVIEDVCFLVVRGGCAARQALLAQSQYRMSVAQMYKNESKWCDKTAFLEFLKENSAVFSMNGGVVSFRFPAYKFLIWNSE